MSEILKRLRHRHTRDFETRGDVVEVFRISTAPSWRESWTPAVADSAFLKSARRHRAIAHATFIVQLEKLSVPIGAGTRHDGERRYLRHTFHTSGDAGSLRNCYAGRRYVQGEGQHADPQGAHGSYEIADPGGPAGKLHVMRGSAHHHPGPLYALHERHLKAKAGTFCSSC